MLKLKDLIQRLSILLCSPPNRSVLSKFLRFKPIFQFQIGLKEALLFKVIFFGGLYHLSNLFDSGRSIESSDLEFL